jgi:phospholipid transport system substrate-binding protein
MKKGLSSFILVLFLSLPLSSFAGAPLDSVKGNVDKVLDVLRDPALKGESGKKAKKAKVRTISEKMFDYNELSRRTLGQNWTRLNTEQQKEFTDLYKSILEDAYVDKIVTYTDEKVLYSKENQLTEKTVEVQTTIVTKKCDIPIFYRVMLKGNEWRIYDVVIEGVSLINNYRTQFREILANKTPEALLETLRKKVGKA